MLYPGRQKKNAKDEKEEQEQEQEEIQKPGLFSCLNWIHPCIIPDCCICEAQESIPSLANRHDNPPGYIGWRNRFLGIDPRFTNTSSATKYRQNGPESVCLLLQIYFPLEQQYRVHVGYLAMKRKQCWNRVDVPGRQATYEGGIDSLESILGLFKSLKIYSD